MHISSWARVGVHVVARDYVDTHIARRPTTASACPSSSAAASRQMRCVPVPSRGGHKGGLAAAVIKQVHVGVSEVPVCEAVDDVVEARLAHSHPRTIVECLVGNGSGGGQAGDNSERQPEEDEDDEAEEVGFGEG